MSVGTAPHGAAAGVLATIAMSLPMLLARRLGIIDRQPPEEITDELASDAGVRLAGPALGLATPLAHLAFGAIAGALFALALRRVGPPPGARPWLGSAYGLLIWALAYRGVLPRLGLIRTTGQAGRARDLVMAVAHVVFGIVLGRASESRRRR